MRLYRWIWLQALSVIFLLNPLEAKNASPCAVISAATASEAIRRDIESSWNDLSHSKKADLPQALRVFARKVSELPNGTRIIFDGYESENGHSIYLRNVQNLSRAIAAEGVTQIQIVSTDPQQIEKSLADTFETWLEGHVVKRRAGLKFYFRSDRALATQGQRPKDKIIRDLVIEEIRTEQELVSFLSRSPAELWDEQNIVKVLDQLIELTARNGWRDLGFLAYRTLEPRLQESIHRSQLRKLTLKEFVQLIDKIATAQIRPLVTMYDELAVIAEEKLQNVDQRRALSLHELRILVNQIGKKASVVPETAWKETIHRIENLNLENADRLETLRDLSSIAWVSVISGKYPSEGFYQSIERAIKILAVGVNVPHSIWHQLRIVELGLKLERGWRFELPESAPTADRLRQQTPTTNRIQERATSVILEMSLGFVADYSIEGFYEADLANPNKKIIIEIDGAIHFNGNGKAITKDRFRERILKALGWKVIHLENREVSSMSNYQLRERVLKELAKVI